MFKINKKHFFLFLLLILLAFAAFITITSLRTRIKREYRSKKIGYRVSIPLNWRHNEHELRFCEGDEFSDYKPPTSYHADAYFGFSVNVCIYRNTGIQEHLRELSAYGDKKTSDFKISGVLPDWYTGKGMIGELNTVLIENRGNVYRISFWLPFQDNQSYYKNEKEKAMGFLKSFEFIDN